MEKIDMDYKQRIWKIEAKFFNMCKPWLSSFKMLWTFVAEPEFGKHVQQFHRALTKLKHYTQGW